mmetsp:Transcript_6603/g.15053  ORF Transcript_6603/g.15053 Transcript_6603/m.15053 type:complete len:229 (+) Transcript_6603:737-1423(+)
MIPSANCDRQTGTLMTKNKSCMLARKTSGRFCHPASRAKIKKAGPPVPKAPISAPPTRPAQMEVGLFCGMLAPMLSFAVLLLLFLVVVLLLLAFVFARVGVGGSARLILAVFVFVFMFMLPLSWGILRLLAVPVLVPSLWIATDTGCRCIKGDISSFGYGISSAVGDKVSSFFSSSNETSTRGSSSRLLFLRLIGPLLLAGPAPAAAVVAPSCRVVEVVVPVLLLLCA